MELKMYSIRDASVKVFHAPMFQPNLAHAKHNFTEIVNDLRTNLNKFPEDFDLYFLGTYDDNTGKMSTLDTPEHVEKAVNVKTLSTAEKQP